MLKIQGIPGIKFPIALETVIFKFSLPIILNRPVCFLQGYRLFYNVLIF